MKKIITSLLLMLGIVQANAQILMGDMNNDGQVNVSDVTKLVDCILKNKRVVRYEYVDLGLNVLWATCNIGASSPEDYGDYFAWGETAPKSNYSWSTYFDSKDGVTFNKYPFTDKIQWLDSSDDAAYVNSGGECRMPDYDDWTYLFLYCKRSFTYINGVYCCRVEGPNGNVIYMPMAGGYSDNILAGKNGRSFYWCDRLRNLNDYDSKNAYCVSLENKAEMAFSRQNRCLGFPVRGVREISDPVHSKNIIFNVTDLALQLGSEYTIQCTYIPSNATRTASVWTTSDSKVATVTNGKIVARGVGSCDIKASMVENRAEATCHVVVEPVKAKSIAIDNSAPASIKVGETCQFEAHIKPNNATYPVKWGSDKPSVATVSEDGIVTGVSSGKARIIAQATEDSHIFDAREVEVQQLATKISLSHSDIKVKEGTSFVLDAILSPDGTSTQKVKWTVTGDAVTQPSDVVNGTFYAAQPGTAQISARTIDGSNLTVNRPCKVTVVSAADAGTVKSVTLNMIQAHLKVGETFTAKATINPATTPLSTVWSSLNPDVATVDWSGCIKAKKEGKAIISATVGEKMAVMIVWVHDTHEYVDLGLPSGTLWATCNVGASDPEGTGLYFAWGDIEGHDLMYGEDYIFSEIKYCWYEDGNYTKYSSNKSSLDKDDDAAYMNWGTEWCMPTYSQVKELEYYCTKKWDVKNGVIGMTYTSSKNGNTIFFPAGGFGDGYSHLAGYTHFGGYWSSDVNTEKYTNQKFAWALRFNDDRIIVTDLSWRYWGLNVRAVRSK